MSEPDPRPIVVPENAPSEAGDPTSSVGKGGRSSSDGVSRQPARKRPTAAGSRTTGAGGDRPKAARPAGAGREADADDSSATGLVICAKSVRTEVDGEADDLPGDVVRLTFPSATEVATTATLFTSATPWAQGDGLRDEQPETLICRVHIGPGVVQLSSQNPVRAAFAAERRVRQHELDVKDHEWHISRDGVVPDFGSQRSITEWSRKSRSNMCRTLASLDYSPLVDGGRTPAMVTLTYPGKDWELVAPSGKAVKRHLTLWRKRLEREYGQVARFVWKLEFQRRGAPHIHLWLALPSLPGRSGLGFRVWLSRAWTEVVDHPDDGEKRKHLLAGTRVDVLEGMKSCDPKRLAIYFTKHSTPDGLSDKEYQNRVPELWQEPGLGPGRFWGRVGLGKAVAIVEVELQDYINARRVLRRWSRTQTTYAEPESKYPTSLSPRTAYKMVERSGGRTDRPRFRRVRRRRQLIDQGGLRGGYALTNSGSGLGSQLARALDVLRGS